MKSEMYFFVAVIVVCGYSTHAAPFEAADDLLKLSKKDIVEILHCESEKDQCKPFPSQTTQVSSACRDAYGSAYHVSKDGFKCCAGCGGKAVGPYRRETVEHLVCNGEGNVCEPYPSGRVYEVETACQDTYGSAFHISTDGFSCCASCGGRATGPYKREEALSEAEEVLLKLTRKDAVEILHCESARDQCKPFPSQRTQVSTACQDAYGSAYHVSKDGFKCCAGCGGKALGPYKREHIEHLVCNGEGNVCEPYPSGRIYEVSKACQDTYGSAFHISTDGFSCCASCGGRASGPY